MFERSFPGLSKLKFSLVCIFAFDLFVFTSGASSPEWPLREEDFFCATCFVSFCVCLLFVLTCLLFYVLESVYIATLAE
jgi:hypothetical protein